ncbi:hypothetical protein A3B48_00175 [Candidatus Gottesmanbacteria bacterium RIFCSPLOWO2_01_FULL_40_10]|uniref:Polysaccharide biosynthesis protein C-terminal domain-containing protein n=1 Tax=Candidatus Gottesmanbacteria bacterium RIFCSPHIGHO2_01_FULL_40_15 TaxID=1798376 RepID=A0A1F5Z215_9BACT|nr:MAG: hypothetical protein A2777_05830 [Candidatus Gottesmanbacteria bacterium RIFCSPHIGHO2_01_FULL_40_15]OGG23188.1 MAG: hypothetical protein A3B48_00175 [Candidatus Gottesmanbacteria bacterium RIFCSPLOWO2_01_FULL_40_10]
MSPKIKTFLPVFFSGTAKDTYIIFTANIFTSFLAFLYTIFLARAFDPRLLGIFSAVTAFILLTSDVLDLGISASLSRFYPEIKRKRGEGNALSFAVNSFKFQLTLTIAVILLIIITSTNLANIFLEDYRFYYLYLLSAAGVLGTVLTAFASALLAARKKFIAVAVISVTSTLTKLLLLVLLFYLNRFILSLVLLAFVVASFVAFSVSTRFLKLALFRDKFSFMELKKLLSYSLFIALSRIFSAVSGKLDALMLIPLSSAFDAGIYSAAYKIAFTYILLAGSFSTVIAPRLASFKDVGLSLPYLKKIILATMLILLSMVVLYAVAPFFVVFILGRRYVLSVDVFRSLLLPTALFVMTIPSVNFLLYVLKKPWVSTFNTFISLVIMFSGNLYFIPAFGRFGPVYSLTGAYGFTLISSVFFAVYYYSKS